MAPWNGPNHRVYITSRAKNVYMMMMMMYSVGRDGVDNAGSVDDPSQRGRADDPDSRLADVLRPPAVQLLRHRPIPARPRRRPRVGQLPTPRRARLPATRRLRRRGARPRLCAGRRTHVGGRNERRPRRRHRVDDGGGVADWLIAGRCSVELPVDHTLRSSNVAESVNKNSFGVPYYIFDAPQDLRLA